MRDLKRILDIQSGMEGQMIDGATGKSGVNGDERLT